MTRTIVLDGHTLQPGDQSLMYEAVASAEEAIRLDPDDASGSFALGLAFSEKKEIDRAIAAYREAIRLDPTYFSAHRNLAGTKERSQPFSRQARGRALEANLRRAFP